MSSQHIFKEFQFFYLYAHEWFPAEQEILWLAGHAISRHPNLSTPSSTPNTRLRSLNNLDNLPQMYRRVLTQA